MFERVVGTALVYGLRRTRAPLLSSFRGVQLALTIFDYKKIHLRFEKSACWGEDTSRQKKGKTLII